MELSSFQPTSNSPAAQPWSYSGPLSDSTEASARETAIFSAQESFFACACDTNGRASHPAKRPQTRSTTSELTSTPLPVVVSEDDPAMAARSS